MLEEAKLLIQDENFCGFNVRAKMLEAVEQKKEEIVRVKNRLERILETIVLMRSRSAVNGIDLLRLSGRIEEIVDSGEGYFDIQSAYERIWEKADQESE